MFSFGCGEDLEFNTPGFQALVDGQYNWKSGSQVLKVEDGNLVITGRETTDELNIVLPSTNVGTYTISSTSSAYITYSRNGISYSTQNNGTGSPAYLSEGEVVIQEAGAGSITGTFWFNAFDATGEQTVNFSRGVMYRLPVTGIPAAGGVGVLNCLTVTTNAATLATEFGALETTAENYTEVCNNYKTALEAVIEACGDTNGTIQQTIDELNCTP